MGGARCSTEAPLLDQSAENNRDGEAEWPEWAKARRHAQGMFGEVEGRLPQMDKGEVHLTLEDWGLQGHAEAWVGPKGLRAGWSPGLVSPRGTYHI